jgi:hypothetical protein
MDLRTTLRPSSPVAPSRAVRPDASRAESAPSDAGPAADAPSADRVEISSQARQAAQSSQPSAPRAESLEIELARTALRAGDGLSDSRLHELRERVRTGYYDYPESVDRIAEAAARDLADADPAE